MYLQKLDIQGFKSFASKTTLEFNRQLTAVVGPNGSGKSNIADAIRWVLGEQSIKLLRGKRAEDVIFAGSDLKGRLGMAEVSLYLNNQDGQAPIEFAEIVVTRRVFRDGQSEYLLNQSPVRLQDIQLLLARSNFGQKTYSVIGQGMIDSILLASPAERKEFFEEATGVKQYQLKREQAIGKLTSTYDNLEQAQALIQEIEPRLRALTRQVKRLERREELERELRELQKQYYRFRFHGLELKRQSLAAATQKHDAALSAGRQASQQLETKLKQLEGADLSGGNWHELQQQQTEVRGRLSQALKAQAVAQAEEEVGHVKRGEGEVALLKQRQRELTAELKRLEQSAEALASEQRSLSQTLVRKLSEQEKVVSQFDEVAKQSGEAWFTQEVSALVEEHSELKRGLSAVTAVSELPALASRVSTIEQRLRTLLKRLESRGKLSSDELAQVLRERDALVNDIANLQANLKALEREQVALNAARNVASSALEKVERALGTAPQVQAANQLPKLAQDIAALEAELAKVEQQLGSFHSEAESRKSEFFTVQRDLTAATSAERKLEQAAHELGLELARLETKLEDLEREMAQEVPAELVAQIKAKGTVAEIDEGAMALELTKLKHQLELTGGIEPEVVTEYQQTKTRYDFLTTQLADLESAIGSLESVIRDLDQTIEKKFLVSFKAIADKFAKYFQVLFSGGKAQLVLQKEEPQAEMSEGETEPEDDGDDEAEEKAQPSAKEKFIAQERLRASLFSGVEITAKPAGKKLSSITALSGGERALTSIALICAIISNNPSPFVVLDEVDAALDEANSERFAAILDSLMGETQFITITHNRATMKRAAILYGVTIGEDGVSKLLSVKFDEALATVAKPKKA
jgi:chromosome segregation protein